MTVLTKKELKGILKECLKEILREEGVVLAESATTTKRSALLSNDPRKRTSSPGSVPSPASKVKNNKLIETIDNLAGDFAVKGDAAADMMRNILADTAATTLQEQHAGGHQFGAGAGSGMMPLDAAGLAMPVSEEKIAQDVAELQALSVDGNTSRWAQVAFASKGKN